MRRKIIGSEAAQFEVEHHVAVVVAHRLRIRHLFGVVQPVDAPGCRDALGQALGPLESAHQLNRPNRHIEHVNALVADLAVAVIPEKPPRVVEAILIEGPRRRGPSMRIASTTRGGSSGITATARSATRAFTCSMWRFGRFN